MKFSLIFEAQMADTSKANEYRVLGQCVEQAVAAEKHGFDAIWAVEHTALTQYAHMSAPEVFLPFVAGRTSRLEIGHGVVCLMPKMNHPVKVAERIAMLDVLSRGRVNFGIGKGGTEIEAGAFGHTLDELPDMVTESMYMIPRIWREDVFEHDGVHFKVPPREIRPKPYQEPHPPMFMACTSEATLDIAGERGIGGLAMGFGGPEDIARKNRIYREAFQRRTDATQVGDYPNEHFAALCPSLVLDDSELARRVGLRGQRFFVEAISHCYGGGPKPSTDDLSADGTIAVLQEAKEQVTAYLSEEKLTAQSDAMTNIYGVDNAYGSVAQAKGYIQRLVDAGADEILMIMQMGTVPHDLIMQSIRNVGEHVIPYFKDKTRATTRKPAS